MSIIYSHQPLQSGPLILRKIVQIAVDNDRLYALCNDSSLWEWRFGEWVRLLDIPQAPNAVMEPEQNEEK